MPFLSAITVPQGAGRPREVGTRLAAQAPRPATRSRSHTFVDDDRSGAGPRRIWGRRNASASPPSHSAPRSAGASPAGPCGLQPGWGRAPYVLGPGALCPPGPACTIAGRTHSPRLAQAGAVEGGGADWPLPLCGTCAAGSSGPARTPGTAPAPSGNRGSGSSVTWLDPSRDPD